MQVALTEGIAGFVIATSDGDFSHLARRLRELGFHVLGMGEEKAPDRFRLACSTFVQLDSGAQQRTVCRPCASPFDMEIRDMIARHGKKGSGMRLVDLAPHMHRAHGTRISTHAERTWRAYLAARPGLYVLDPRGENAMVRCRVEGFALQ